MTADVVSIDTGCPMPDGVYSAADLSADDYLALKRGSQTLFKAAASGTMHAWAQSWLNPRRTSYDSDAKKTGRAYHKYILEGADAFDAEFAPVLDRKDFTGALVTTADLIEWLKQKKLALPSGRAKKEDYIKMVMRHPEHPVIWDIKKADHESDHQNKTLLRSNIIEEIKMADYTLRLDKHSSASVSNGDAEVSVLYHHVIEELDGSGKKYRIPCKARFDYLRLKAITDLKTFSSNPNETFKRAVVRAIASYRYNVQAAGYRQAWEAALPLIADQKIIGNPGFKQRMADAARFEKSFFFLFQMAGLPVSRLFQFPLSGSIAYDAGQTVLKEGQINFARCYEAYGTDPWLEVEAPEMLTDDDFPQYMFY